MRRSFLIFIFCLTAMSFAQDPWNVVWRMTAPPYLTHEQITEMGMVKAGFDTDKDGWGEFICAWTDLDTNAIMMYEATGNNTYALVWSYVYPVEANSFAGFTVGDINNNGVVEIITTMPSVVGTDPNPPRLWVLEWNGVVGENKYGVFNSGTGRYDASASWNFDLPADYDFRPYSLIVEDIDKDSLNELIVGVRGAGSGTSREIRVVSAQGEYDGFVIWETEWSYAKTFGGSLYNVTTGDLDNDGNREIYAFIWNFFTMKIFECTGNKQYTEVFSVEKLFAAAAIDHGALDAVRVADVNKDGVNEMYIAATEPANQVFILTGVTDVSQIDSTKIKRLYTIPRTAGGKFRSMYIADPDRDGNADLMIGGELNGQIFSLEYKGTGNPADSSSWEHRIIYNMWNESGLTTISPRLFYGSPAADMDKDGNDEYVFVNYSPDFGTWPDDSPLRMIEINRSTGVDDNTMLIPNGMLLINNYPNPFNPTTTVTFTVPATGNATVKVYNALGQIVATLFDGVAAAGEVHRTTFNASHLAGGVYFARLASGSQSQMRKLVVVK